MKKAKAKKATKTKSAKAAPKGAKSAKKEINKKDVRLASKSASTKVKKDTKASGKLPNIKSEGKAGSKITAKPVGKPATKVASKVVGAKTPDLSKKINGKAAVSSSASAPLTGKAAARAAAIAKAGPIKGSKNLTKAEKNAEVLAQLQSIADEPEIVLTNADGKQYCRVHDCDNESTTEGLCRLHYLALWKRNRVKAKILQGGKLDKYIEDLTSKYPDKYLEMLRKDLASEKDFNLIIAEMDVEDSGDDAESEDDANRFIEEVRGGVPTSDDDDPGF